MPAVAAVGRPAVAAAERGRLNIADRVLTRIAGRVAREALAGAWVGRTGTGGTPRVSVSPSHHGGTRLTLGLELPFPADLAALARLAQVAVTEQLAALTGAEIVEVTVLIERLVPVEAER
ncbi:hypothetical protein [Kitasatospora sp. MAP5-34]|uniref:hypothetical protein n=1 Tax=Kitasatospora sp. MAP5-34 TaxID=3035102 RepID=UPI00247632AB|nr:hypothetical protein [Kitasatospora sp. MAP5-34]MDH6578487.1 putative alkaline shock family protein YloU [Kitasatospora sp. MAP5-34]